MGRLSSFCRGSRARSRPSPTPRSRALSAETVSALREALRPDYRDAFDWLLLAGARAGNAVAHRRGALAEARRHRPRRRRRPLAREVAGSRAAALWRSRCRRRCSCCWGTTSGTTRTPCSPTSRGTTREHRGGERILRGQRYPITYGAFYAVFKRAAGAIGRPELRVHDLRHTAGTNTLRATGNLVMAQQLLAHQSINTTRRYAHVLRDDLREALERVHETTLRREKTRDAG